MILRKTTEASLQLARKNKFGIRIWKDKNIVYCFSSASKN
jgi:hypothetical protein